MTRRTRLTKDKKKFLTLGKVGYKVKPRLMRMFGRWYPVGKEEWDMVQKVELEEVDMAKKKKSKKKK